MKNKIEHKILINCETYRHSYVLAIFSLSGKDRLGKLPEAI